MRGVYVLRAAILIQVVNHRGPSQASPALLPSLGPYLAHRKLTSLAPTHFEGDHPS